MNRREFASSALAWFMGAVVFSQKAIASGEPSENPWSVKLYDDRDDVLMVLDVTPQLSEVSGDRMLLLDGVCEKSGCPTRFVFYQGEKPLFNGSVGMNDAADLLLGDLTKGNWTTVNLNGKFPEHIYPEHLRSVPQVFNPAEYC